MEQTWLAERFEELRPRLRAVAWRMLGSATEADDAVQETWMRLSRSDADAIDNLGAWLTTVVGRVSLSMLRARKTHREDPLELGDVEPLVDHAAGSDPEHEAVLADSVGMALLVVLETLSPRERLAFVLYDMFGVPYDEIAEILDCSPDAARQVASRARRRVRGVHPNEQADPVVRREVVDAFLAAAREGDFGTLVRLLDPDVVLRVDNGALAGGPRILRGADAIASQAVTYARMGLESHRALVGGTVGMVSVRDGKVFAAGRMTVRKGQIAGIDILTDPKRLEEIEVVLLDDKAG